MNALALLGAFGTLLAAGYGVLSLLVRGTMRLGFTEQIALSWLLGTGAVSLLLWIFGFFVNWALLPGLVSIVCFALGLFGWKHRIPFQLRRSHQSSEIFLSVIVVIEIAIVFYLAFVHTLGWDGLLNWEIKARYAFVNGGVLPAIYFSDSGRAFSHPEYPLAIPFTELWLYLWLGQPDQFWAKTIFPIFYLVGTFLLTALGARLTGRTWMGLLLAAFLFFIPQVTVEVGSAIAGYVDFPLSVFYLAAIGFLLCAIRQNNDTFFRLYAACLALLPWVKRDGLILWVVAALCGLFAILRTKKSFAYLLLLLPGLLVIVSWRLYLSLLHTTASSEFLPVTIATFGSHFYRVGPLLLALLQELMNFHVWSLFWIVVAVASVYLLRRLRDPENLILLTALFVPMGLYLSVYVFSNWPDYLDHVGLSISRLLMHVAPVGLLIAVLAVFSRRPEKIGRQIGQRALTCVTAGSERTAVVEFA
jgi:hypothetical protein